MEEILKLYFYKVRRALLILWRIWFWLLASIPIIFLFPILVFILFLPNFYKHIFWIARNVWAPIILYGMGFRLEIKYKGGTNKNQQFMFVANHTSYIDPFIMLRVVKQPFVFVGKKELVKIPLFGYIYKHAAIMVDRSSSKSRYGVYGRADKVLDKGYSVCIFPEKDYLDETILLNPFKHGAFKIAVFHHFPVVPMLFLDCKRKQPWYTTHGYPGKLRVNVYPSVSTKGMTGKDVPKLLDNIYNFMESELREDPERASLKAINIWKRINKIS
tara:strand:- start:2225 stop:3040 length:816 start_codon:yes stop_codon:yes gene_type:complete